MSTNMVVICLDWKLTGYCILSNFIPPKNLSSLTVRQLGVDTSNLYSVTSDVWSGSLSHLALLCRKDTVCPLQGLG